MRLRDLFEWRGYVDRILIFAAYADICKAIHWAIEPPRSVDIVSISAGFRNYSKELDDAVTKAKAAGVLVIAAASNWQNTNTVAFPARHNLSTMCIYSTNTGNQSSSFNPEPRADTQNFAIIGEGFQHPDQRRNERMSGTSSKWVCLDNILFTNYGQWQQLWRRDSLRGSSTFHVRRTTEHQSLERRT